jgi:hypothetical protein
MCAGVNGLERQQVPGPEERASRLTLSLLVDDEMRAEKLREASRRIRIISKSTAHPTTAVIPRRSSPISATTC